MASFYADEQFPFQVVELLRNFEHDVLTVQEAGGNSLQHELMGSESRGIFTRKINSGGTSVRLKTIPNHNSYK
jgi:hypothetical protein